MHQPGSRVRPIFWDIVLKALNAFVLVSPHTCTLGQGQGLGLGMSCARWTRFVHLYRWLRDMQACQKQRGESWAARLGSLCPSTVSEATSSHCAAQLPSLPARTMPSASVSGSQVAWLCLVTPVGRFA